MTMIIRVGVTAAATLLLVSASAMPAPIDLSLFGTYSSGDYGTSYHSDVQATVFRFSAGDRFQLRFEAPYLRVLASDSYQDELAADPTPGHTGGSGLDAGDESGQITQSDPAGSQGPSAPGHSSSDRFEAPTVAPWTSGMGDLWLGGYVRLLGGGAKLYRIDTGVGVKAPTASTEENLGTGEWDYRLSVSGEYRFWSANTFGTVGWSKLGDTAWLDFNDILDFVLGAESEPLFDRVVVSGWVEGNQEAVPGYGGRTALGIGLRSIGRYRWRALATTGLSRSAADYSFLLGVSMGVEPPKTGIRGIPF